MPDPLEGEALFDFHILLERDRRAGAVAQVEAYVERFPSQAEAVRTEYARFASRAPERDERRVGPYRTLATLGRGGQGTVYLAEHTRDGRRVALKVLDRSEGWHATRRARLRREAEAIMRLEHPGLCAILEAELEAESPYLAMRLVEGEPFSRTLARAEQGERGGAAPCAPRDDAELRRLLALFAGFARALHAAHEAGVAHRDIKPANLMITPEGAGVILDFGLAQDVGGGGPTLTRTGDLLGTLEYLPPERLRGPERQRGKDPTDARMGDVYSLGVTLYQALTLSLPFEATSLEGLVRSLDEDSVPDARRRNARIDRDLQRVLEAALERNPARRYASALAFARDLERAARSEPVHARPPGAPARLARLARRHPVGVALLAATIFWLALALTWTRASLEREHEARLGQEALLEQRGGTYLRESARLQRAALPSASLAFALEAERRDPGHASNQLLLELLSSSYPEVIYAAYGSEFEVLAAPNGRQVASFERPSGVVRLVEIPNAPGLGRELARDVTLRVAEWSADGRCFAWVDEQHALRVFDEGHALGPAALDLGPAVPRTILPTSNGARVLIVDADGALRIARPTNGTVDPLESAPDRPWNLRALWSRDGQRLVTAFEDAAEAAPEAGGVRVHELATPGAARVLAPGEREVRSLLLDAEGARLWIGTQRGALLLFDVATGRRLAEAQFDGALLDLALDASEELLGVTWDPTRPGSPGAALLDPDELTTRIDLVGHEDRAVRRIAFDPSGAQRVATASYDGTLRIWSTTDGAELETLRENTGFVRRLAWSPDGRRLVGQAESANGAFAWRTDRARFPIVVPARLGPLEHVRFAGSNRDAVVGSSRGDVAAVAFDGAQVRRLRGGSGAALGFLAYDAEHGGRVLCADADGAVESLALADGRLLWRRALGAGLPLAARVPRAERLAVVAGRDALRLLDLDDGRTRAELARPAVEVTALAVSDDGAWLALGDSNRTVRLWRLLPTIEEQPAVAAAPFPPISTRHNRVFSLAFDPESRRLAAVCETVQLRVWECASGALLFDGPSGRTAGGVLFANERADEVILTAKWSGRVGRVSLADGRYLNLGQGQGQSSAITAFAVHRELGLLATAAKDRTVALSDLGQLELRLRLEGAAASVTDVDFSPSGDRLAAASWDGSVRVYPTDPRALAAERLPRGSTWRTQVAELAEALAGARAEHP